MQHSTLEELALRWVPGDGPVVITALTAGIVNESCRVSRAGKRYSLRVAAREAQDLGLDRRWECQVLRLAASAELAPLIVHCDPLQGVLVAEWVDGRTWTAAEIQLPAATDAMAELLRRVHALPMPQPARVMSPAAWGAHYAAVLTRHSVDAASWLPDLREPADARLRWLTALGEIEPVLCHGDLHRPNIVVGDRTLLLDWEYAHSSDPFWDLAGWVANNDLTQDLTARFLASYLGRPPCAAEQTRLDVLTWLYDYICVLWSALYLSQRPDAESRDVAARARALTLRLKRAAGSRAG